MEVKYRSDNNLKEVIWPLNNTKTFWLKLSCFILFKLLENKAKHAGSN